MTKMSTGTRLHAKALFLLVLLIGLGTSLPTESGESAQSAEGSNLKLWYSRPGEQWIEALPVGNGRLGAMVYGRTARELIPLNEDTIWTGGPYEPSAPLRAAELPDVRKLVFEGKYRKAQELLGRVFETEPRGHQKYQPLGTLKIDFPGHEEFRDYRRELDLDTAIAGVSYRAGAVRYSREVFASPVDQVIVVRLTADQPGKISFSASLLGAANIPPGDETFAVEPSGSDGLLLKGRTASYRGVKGRLEYRALLKARPEGGRIAVAAGGLTVTGANAVTLLIPAATNFLNYKDLGADPAARIAAAMAGALKKSYAELRRDHVAEHQRLFRRVRLDLAEDSGFGASDRRAAPAVSRGRRSAAGRPLFPVRALSSDVVLPPGDAAGQSPGDLERQNEPVVGQQVYDQHQPADELLAGRSGQSGRVR